MLPEAGPLRPPSCREMHCAAGDRPCNICKPPEVLEVCPLAGSTPVSRVADRVTGQSAESARSHRHQSLSGLHGISVVQNRQVHVARGVMGLPPPLRTVAEQLHDGRGRAWPAVRILSTLGRMLHSVTLY